MDTRFFSPGIVATHRSLEVYLEWFEKQKRSSELQFCGWKHHVDERGQRSEVRREWPDWKSISGWTTAWGLQQQETTSGSSPVGREQKPVETPLGCGGTGVWLHECAAGKPAEITWCSQSQHGPEPERKVSDISWNPGQEQLVRRCVSGMLLIKSSVSF